MQLTACRLSGLQAPGCRFADVAFAGCRLDGANFRMTSGKGAELEDCDLADPDFRPGGDQVLAAALAVFAVLGTRVDDEL